MSSLSQSKNQATSAADSTALKRFLGLGQDSPVPTYYRDAVFVAIDFEGNEHEHLPGVNQIGVSTLDTRDLPHASELGQNMIQAKLYCIPKPGSKRRALRRFQEEMSKRFKFSEPEWITREQIQDTLITIFRERGLDSCAPSEPRNIVLVGHALHNELRNMERLGFRPESHARIIARFDTQHLAKEIRGETESTKLRKLVRDELSGKNVYAAGAQSSKRPFHNAGNDAVFTLEAMLLLMLKDYRETIAAPTWWWIKLTKLSIPTLMESASAKLGTRIASPHTELDLDTSEPTSDVTGTEEVPPAFLLAAARWQMIRQAGQTCAVQAFDAEAQLLAGSVAYNAAACAMPLCFALAPPWHLHCHRS